MKPKVLGCVGVLLVLLLLASVLLNVGLLVGQAGAGFAMDGGAPVLRSAPFEAEQLVAADEPGTRDRIVQLDVTGVITGDSGPGGGSMVEEIKRALHQAVEDSRVKAIVLRIDSPGGEVTASDTLYAAVKEAAAKKTVVAYLDSVAASGGYYIACGAERIVAHPTGITGSIGVIMSGYGVQGLMVKAGVETRALGGGARRNAGGVRWIYCALGWRMGGWSSEKRRWRKSWLTKLGMWKRRMRRRGGWPGWMMPRSCGTRARRAGEISLGFWLSQAVGR